MINLAGVETADETILEELYLAGVDPIKIDRGNTEVPYTYIAKIGKWKFRRAWYYWIVSIDEGVNGLPLEIAVELYNKKHPTKDIKLGEVVRAGGDAGSILPTSYVAQPVYNEDLDAKLELLGYKKEYHKLLKREYISISSREVAELCNSGKLDVERYVDCYHVDDQIGLTELVKILKCHSKPENAKGFCCMGQVEY